jgi:hypothetical protein
MPKPDPRYSAPVAMALCEGAKTLEQVTRQLWYDRKFRRRIGRLSYVSHRANCRAVLERSQPQ